MGAVLTTQPVQNVMRKQGFIPGRELGKNLQDKPSSVSEEPKIIEHPHNKTGLGNLS